MIKHSFSTISKEMFHVLYGTYIRPHLEYCVQVWASYYLKDMKTLEKVQQRATNLVKSIKNKSYDARLKYLGLFSLDRRRLRGGLIATFKIVNGIKGTNSDYFLKRETTVQLREHKDKLFKSRSKLLCRKNFFSQSRVVNL